MTPLGWFKTTLLEVQKKNKKKNKNKNKEKDFFFQTKFSLSFLNCNFGEFLDVMSI
jgi:hypothetical protein